jgi:galactose mutarotase-like enzyme
MTSIKFEDSGVVTLVAGRYTASVCPSRGAELCSLTFRERATPAFSPVELLHRGLNFSAPPSPQWYGHAQLLFPAVGRHRDGRYTWEGEARPMPLHGLAMGAPFSPESSVAGAEECYLRCAATEAALPAAAAAASYPFPFSLSITFTLSDARGLSVRHELTSRRAAGNLPFALGNHLSFTCPLVGGTYPGGPSAEQVLEEKRAIWLGRCKLRGTVAAQLELAPGSLLSGVASPAPAFSSAEGAPLDAPGATDGVFLVGDGGWVALETGFLRVRVAQRLLRPAGGAAAACDWARLARESTLMVLWGAPPGSPEAGGGDGFLCVEPWLGGPDALNCAPPALAPGETVAWDFHVDAAGIGDAPWGPVGF